MADIIRTIGATGADYTTLAAWWAARTGGAGDVYIGELIDNADYPWGEVTGTYAGSVRVRPATNRKLDLTNPSAPHAKITGSGTVSALYWRSLAHLTIEDLEIASTSTSATCLRLGAFEDTNTTIKRCLIRGGSTGISHGRATATTLVENCVVTEAQTWGINNGFAGITVRNTVVVDNNVSNTASRGGLRKDIAGVTLDNVTSFGNLRDDFFGATTTATVSYLTSGDTDATGANALTGITSAAFTNYAGEVYTAAAGGALDNTGPGGTDRGLNLSVADVIIITSPYDWQFFARNKATNTGSIAITGTYSGGTVPTSIEARWNGGAWTVITASPAGGTFSGTLTGLTSGNGTLEVRYSNATTVTDSVDNVAIGAKLLFWGQSNFSGRANNAQAYTGTAGFFHKYTVTNNLWQQGADPFDTDTASGSLFPLLANQLVAAIGCPVAFIGVAAGSTTLAQWQVGQTLNTRMLNYISAAASDGLEAVCSWIGESDAAAATPEADFKTRYNAVIDQLKTLTGIDSMLVAISGLNLTDYANVRQWINDIAASNANASDTVPQIWPLYQKIHYETDTETAQAATAIFNGISANFYTAPSMQSVATWQVSSLLWQSTAAATVPAFQSTTAWQITPLQWQVQAAASAPGAIASTAAWSVWAIQWQSTAAATVPAFQSTAAWAVSPLQWQGAAETTAPGAAASTVSWSISPLQWQSQALTTEPSFNTSASWQITPLLWQVSASIGGAPVFVSKGASITDRIKSCIIIERQ